jgi:nucleoside-diphosphate-sugar epimerase
MRVFVTGASGWIGSAVLPELLAHGHQVVGLARSDRSANVVTTAGAEVVRGTLEDLDVLRATAAASDGVVHLGFSLDSGGFDEGIRIDAAATDAVIDALAGTDKPFIATSGTSVVPGQVSTEHDAPDLSNPVAGRFRIAETVLTAADRGVRSAVVGMPRSVHGDGDRFGFIPIMVAAAREHGVSGYLGDGTQRWPAVHVRDAARLYRLALEGAPAGTRLHAVGDEGVRMRDIAEVIGRHLVLPVGPVDPAVYGFLGGVFAMDQPSAAPVAHDLLGWSAEEDGLLDDIEAGHYFR